jgi:hypothetical protein
MRTQRAAFIWARMISAAERDIQQGRVERCSLFLNAYLRIVSRARSDGGELHCSRGTRPQGVPLDRRPERVTGGRLFSRLPKSDKSSGRRQFFKPTKNVLYTAGNSVEISG